MHAIIGTKIKQQYKFGHLILHKDGQFYRCCYQVLLMYVEAKGDQWFKKQESWCENSKIDDLKNKIFTD